MLHEHNFRPTSLGSNPSAGHLEARQKLKEIAIHYFNDKFASGFQQTTLEDGSKADRSFEINSNSIASGQQHKHTRAILYAIYILWKKEQYMLYIIWLNENIVTLHFKKKSIH